MISSTKTILISFPNKLFCKSYHISEFLGFKASIDCTILSELGVFLFPVGLEDNSSDNSAPALKSEKGPHLAYFGEIHPAIIKNLDFKDKNIFGFEIFLKNIPEPNKKIRQSKISYQESDYQKSERDFDFVIDKLFKIDTIEKIIKEENDT